MFLFLFSHLEGELNINWVDQIVFIPWGCIYYVRLSHSSRYSYMHRLKTTVPEQEGGLVDPCQMTLLKAWWNRACNRWLHCLKKRNPQQARCVCVFVHKREHINWFIWCVCAAFPQNKPFVEASMSVELQYLPLNFVLSANGVTWYLLTRLGFTVRRIWNAAIISI